MMTKVYRSKIDTWLIVVLVATMMISLYACIHIASAGPNIAWWALVITVIAGVVLPAWLVLNTTYHVQAQQLLVRSGPFRWHIGIAEITSIRPSNNPLSSPALSLDRLRIDYGKGRFIMVSPRDKEDFLKTIEERRRAY